MLPSWKIVSELLERLGDEQHEKIRFGGKWEPLVSLDAESSGIMIYERNQKK